MITDFSQGLITNVAYNSRSRTPPAQEVSDSRVNEQGWLVPRKGRIAVERFPEPSIVIPALPSVDSDSISVTYGEEGGLGPPGEFRPVALVFQAAVVDVSALPQELPDQQGDTGEPPPLLSPKTIVGEKSEPVTVETIDVINAQDDFGEFAKDPTSNENYRANVHTLRAFYNGNDKTIEIGFRIVGDINLAVRIVHFESKQVVRNLRDTTYLDGGSQDEEPDQTGDNQGPRRKQVTWDGLDDFGVPVPAGKYYVEFHERRPLRQLNLDTDDPDDYLPVTAYEDRYSYLGFDLVSTVVHITASASDDANYIDVYSTLGDRRQGYYWIARMAVGETLVYRFPILDENTPQVLEFETPSSVYTAKNDFRIYAAEANSNRLYLSHYDPGTGERLLYNFTDFIDVELGDKGYITGLAFIRDTHLVVYASNQIKMYATDALVELHQRIDYIEPHDDKGERIGCAAPDSIVDMGGSHYFLATNRYIYMFDGHRVLPMSDAVHGIFQQVALERTADDNVELETGIVGFAHNKHYMLSLSADKTMVFDSVHRVWWQDSFGVSRARRDETGRVYGMIDGNPYILYEGDDDAGVPIRRVFKCNPYKQHSHSQWDSVHVYAQGPAEIDVTCSTEQGEFSDRLSIPNAGDWWSQRMGVNLQGRYYQVEITTESLVAIDRIMVNERPRKIRGR